MQTTRQCTQEFSLTSQQIDDFNKLGYAGPFTLYEPEEMKAVWKRVRLELIDRRFAPYRNAEEFSDVFNISNYDRHLDNSFLASHICRLEIVDKICNILGPDVLCWRSEFFIKYPGTEGTDWHQADDYGAGSGSSELIWPNELRPLGGALVAWTAFTEATIENGCLQLIPGSHRTKYYDESKRLNYDEKRINKITKNGVLRGFFGYDYRELLIDPKQAPDESKALSFVMRPGQFLLFWSTVAHASHPHSGKTKDTRVGFTARYVPTSVRVYPGTDSLTEYGGKISLENYGTVLVAGKDEFGHNRIASRTAKGELFNVRRRNSP